MNHSKTILLIDDHDLVRDGIARLIAQAYPQAQISSAGTLAEGIEQLTQAQVDLVLLDLSLGDVHGMAGLFKLRKLFPVQAIAILSGQDDRNTVLAALEAGARGFISKAAPMKELIAALQKVIVDGGEHLPKTTSPQGHNLADGKDLSELAELGITVRQIEVLSLLVQGLRNKEIGQLLDLSEVTVKKHVTAALQILGVPNRARALVVLQQQGYRLGSVNQ